MCAIFGLLDYKGQLTAAQRLRTIKVLGTAAEVRGTDATGIAFFQRDRLCIQKAAKPAHKMKYRIPASVRIIMGHTRLTTQGNASHNQNNHPFPGKAGNTAFALAHNGVLTNELELRKQYHLPETDIETDSYLAVQLIEQQKEVSPRSLSQMAELLEGHFTFTVLEQDSLYFIKGNNPLTIYQFPTLGLYLYASTMEILDRALAMLGMEQEYQVIQPKQGEILQIDHFGRQSKTMFKTDRIDWDWPYSRWDSFSAWTFPAPQQDYVEELKSIAKFYGYDEDFVDRLLAEGFAAEDIEDFIYCREGFLCEY